MGQRVNIQYSVDLEDLTWEVTAMISRANSKMITAAGVIDEILRQGTGSHLTLDAVTAIADLRERLADIDFTLEDISNIISGYVTHAVQNTTQPEPTQAQQSIPTADIPSSSGVEALQDMIDQFKEQIEPETNEVSDQG
jgi:hypothetical protein